MVEYALRDGERGIMNVIVLIATLLGSSVNLVCAISFYIMIQILLRCFQSSDDDRMSNDDLSI